MSQAAELTKWVKYRAQDVLSAHLVVDYVRSLTPAQKREYGLDMLHNAVAIVRTDARVIAREAARLNLCDCHHSGEQCTTRPPF